MKTQNGCLVAFLVIGGILGVALAIYIAVFSYIMQETLKVQHRRHKASPPVPAEKPLEAAPAQVVTSGDGAFVRDTSLRVSGYYKPSNDVAVGVYHLTEIHLGVADDFAATEKNGLGPDAEPPFVLVFAKSAPSAANAPDAPQPKPEVVVCRRYKVTRDALACEGEDALLGKVAFQGRMSPEFIAKIAVKGDPQVFYHEGAVTGDVAIGKTSVQKVPFAYWAEE